MSYAASILSDINKLQKVVVRIQQYTLLVRWRVRIQELHCGSFGSSAPRIAATQLVKLKQALPTLFRRFFLTICSSYFLPPYRDPLRRPLLSANDTQLQTNFATTCILNTKHHRWVLENPPVARIDRAYEPTNNFYFSGTFKPEAPRDKACRKLVSAIRHNTTTYANVAI